MSVSKARFNRPPTFRVYRCAPGRTGHLGGYNMQPDVFKGVPGWYCEVFICTPPFFLLCRQVAGLVLDCLGGGMCRG